MGRVLWVHSDFHETGTYRTVLAERGYSVDGERNAVDALPKLDKPYDIIFFSPYLLSWGDSREGSFPDGVSRGDSLDLGLWFYDRIRESRNSATPLFLVPLGLRSRELRDRVHERMKKDSSIVQLCDLIEAPPNQLYAFVKKTLSERSGVLLF